ncbi:MAG: hypothetical protein Q9169_004771 [Polycauliona sp. 2 TL-2023]
MSLQTTTAMVTKMETVVLAAICAAPPQASESQSSQELVTAGAWDGTATPAAVPSSSSDSSIPSASSAAQAASDASPEPCECACLCPMAAFPMAAYQMAPNTTQAIATSSTQTSTFTTVVTKAVGNLIVVSSVGGETPTTVSTGSTTTTSSMSQITTATSTKVSGVLPTEIVTDPGTGGGAQAQQKNALDAPLDIDNYSLLTSVNLPMIVGRASEPTAGVGRRS